MGGVLEHVAARRGRDEGFTLIELLVVIIIIGILAAIAIPVFLGQRIKGYDANAKSDLRNLAQFEEAYLSSKDNYGTIAQLQSDGEAAVASHGVTLSVVFYNGSSSFCLSAKHVGSPHTWYWDSSANGPQAQGVPGCPVTTSGTAGDSVTGP